MGSRVSTPDTSATPEADGAVALLLSGPEASGGFARGAVDAAHELMATGQVSIDIRYGHSGPPEPAWKAVLCHGGQWAAWLREFDVTAGRPAAMTDRVAVSASGDPLGTVTMVDWHWDQASYLAGAVAAHVAGRGSASDGEPVPALGLLAGPPVPTQRRVTSAFTAGALAAGHQGEVVIAHAATFDDRSGGDRLARKLVAGLGCTVLAHAADSAGEEGCRVAREHGTETIGFIEPLGIHLACVDSDIKGVVGRLLQMLASGDALPSLFHADLASGYLDLVVRDPALAQVVAEHRPAAALI